MDFAEIIMNPVRQRIVQKLLLSGQATVAEIADALTDVPRPSIYRHMKLLLEADCVKVVAERPARGAVEKTYALVDRPAGLEPTNENMGLLINSMLMSLAGGFARYFAREDADPRADMLSFGSSTLMLSDEEFMEFLNRVGAVINDYINNTAAPGRKPRSITIISSPVQDDERKKTDA